MTARDVISVILGEATSGTRAERFADMVAISSAISNRATTTNSTVDDVISAQDKRGNPQFDAYGKALPAGVEAYRDLAQEAWNYVQEFGPTHNGAFYGRPGADLGIKGLQTVDQTKGHTFYSDPQGRGILVGNDKYVQPTQQVALPQTAPIPTATPTPVVPSLAAYAPEPNRANLPFDDIVAPTSVRTSSVDPYAVTLPDMAPVPSPAPSIPAVPSTSGLGLAALAPNGLIGGGFAAPGGPREVGQPSFGATSRPAPPGTEVFGIVDGAVKSVLGPEWSVDISSGTYPPNVQANINATLSSLESRGISPTSRQGKAELEAAGQYGSTRHNNGKAMDYSVVNTVTGQTLARGVDDDKLNDIAREAAARGVTAMGYGKGYMDNDGTTRFHMDIAGQGTWGANNRGVNADPAARDAFNEGRLGVGALPNTYNPGGIPEPTSRDAALAQIEAEKQAYQDMALGLGAAGIPNVGGTTSMFAAPVGDVERSALPSIPSVPDALLAEVSAIEGQFATPAPSNTYTQGLAELSGLTQGFTAPAPSQTYQDNLAELSGITQGLGATPSVPTAAPAVPSLADAYGQFGSSMTQAGITGLGGMPSTPATAPAPTPAPSLASAVPSYADSLLSPSLMGPAQSLASSVPSVPAPSAMSAATPAPAATPATPTPSTSGLAPSTASLAPAVPSTPTVAAPATPAAPATSQKSESTSIGSRLGHAAIGGAIGGLPGAIVGGLIGPAITSTARDALGGIGKSLGINNNTPSTSTGTKSSGFSGLGGVISSTFGGLFDSNIQMPETTYSVGRGPEAIGSVFSGALGPGATAVSIGNPNVSFTSLGGGMVAKTNSELGTTSLVNASSFNWGGPLGSSGTASKSASSWGLGDFFGGLGDAVSDAFSGWGGDSASTSTSSSGGYGPNSSTDPSDSW